MHRRFVSTITTHRRPGETRTQNEFPIPSLHCTALGVFWTLILWKLRCYYQKKRESVLGTYSRGTAQIHTGTEFKVEHTLRGGNLWTTNHPSVSQYSFFLFSFLWRELFLWARASFPFPSQSWKIVFLFLLRSTSLSYSFMPTFFSLFLWRQWLSISCPIVGLQYAYSALYEVRFSRIADCVF